ncbi:photosynthetic complex assembly protein 2 [Erythrobacter sp. KY5]|uniref:putative photosynthetic complex assembly protein PuhE n=1 Tax=Erythrobacter sp. KY5 TaxID=2011159 RepID=UPI000DBEFA81|nr:putative photosynthetic complex assembly protein PuhE [Erythrobacter sp. KY5]AWW75546.1 photosynthetic complex assembly protein 2 [Erythrobacter sp. KY5]
MVSWSGHILPFIVTVMIWFLATGLIAFSVTDGTENRGRATFRRSVAVGGAAGIAGLIAILLTSQHVSVAAVYVSFVGALLVWGWHEIGFLTGAAAGPRRSACQPGARGMDRFMQASATVIHHEIALALTALMLISLSWNAANQIGAMVFVLMFALRLSSKVNLFVGVPNSTTEMLPPHLSYLKSYFGRNRMTWLLAVSIGAILATAAWFASLAISAPLGSAEMTGASLLTALCLLGALEHFFLALPFRDGMLWGWALPQAGARPGSQTDLGGKGGPQPS